MGRLPQTSYLPEGKKNIRVPVKAETNLDIIDAIATTPPNK
jgi:hypothetical protein